MKTTMQSGVTNGMFLLRNYSENSKQIQAGYQDSMIESIIESIVEPIIFKC